MPESDNNIIMLGDNQIPEFEQTQEGTLPPLPLAEASDSQDNFSQGNLNTVLCIVLIFLIIVLLVMIISRKKNNNKKQKTANLDKQENNKNTKDNQETSDSNQAQRLVTKQPYLNPDERKNNQISFTFSTPKNLDLCIKKFLEITKNK